MSKNRARGRGKKRLIRVRLSRLTGLSRLRRIRYTPITFKRRRKPREAQALGAIFIIGLIVLLLFIILIRSAYGGFFAVRVNIRDVAAMKIPPSEITYIYEICDEQQREPRMALTTYLIYNSFFPEKQTAKTKEQLQMDFFSKIEKIQKRIPDNQFNKYYGIIETLTTEMKCFPLPLGTALEQSSYMYGDTWSTKREMCGSGNHTGTDVFDRENIPGRLPVVSMTAGTVEEKGKNGRGGMYVGIRTDRGTYYLYDNMERINENIEKGTAAAPGMLLGYMGNGGGAGNNSVKGNVPANVHIGVRVRANLSKSEFWINPYPFLRHLEYVMFSQG